VRGGWREGSAGRLLLIWNAFIFLFFSLSGSKLSGYIAPMFPALALLLGRQLALSLPGVTRPHAIGIALFGALIAVAAPLVMPHLGNARTPAELLAAAMPWAVAAGAVYALGAGLSAVLAGRGQRTASILALGLAGLGFGQALNFGYQVFSPTRCDRFVAQLIRDHAPADAPVFSVGYYNQTLPFYLKRTVTLVSFTGEFELGQQQEPEKWIRDLPEFAARWKALPAAAGATRPETFEQLEKLGLAMTVQYRDARRVVFTKS
jgi:4-amino-4-deoxy-L-arabinose transferase-like glycosyltransferase